MPGYASTRFETYRLLEITVPSEYNALTDGQKEKYKMIISCGHFDTAIGTVLRNVVEQLFPVGTSTRTLWDNLLSYTPPGP